MKHVHPLRRLGDECSLFRPGRRGFTLLEMCIVLFIIALLFGVSMPALQSAFTEQHVRNDAHQIALMVKTAMIQSAEQHRPYVIDLTATTASLHPAGVVAKEVDTSDATNADPELLFKGNDADDAPAPSAPEDVVATTELDPPNKLRIPDPEKQSAYIDLPVTQWTFEPGELCPATTIRLVRGEAWIEMSFNALTGNVEKESTYFP